MVQTTINYYLISDPRHFKVQVFESDNMIQAIRAIDLYRQREHIRVLSFVTVDHEVIQWRNIMRIKPSDLSGFQEPPVFPFGKRSVLDGL